MADAPQLKDRCVTTVTPEASMMMTTAKFRVSEKSPATFPAGASAGASLGYGCPGMAFAEVCRANLSRRDGGPRVGRYHINPEGGFGAVTMALTHRWVRCSRYRLRTPS
jgi:hypothetical protein